jgi:hypothetical protein
MKPNRNFHNQYEMMIQKEDREKVLSLFNKMSVNRPGLSQEAKISMKDEIDGRVYLLIDNMEAFDDNTAKVVRRFLNSFKYKTVNKLE